MRALPPAAQLYVYYRVAQAQAAEAIDAVNALHAELAAQQRGLQCSVLQRAGGSAATVADSLTLMEVYRLEGGVGIGAALAAQIDRSAQVRLGAWLLGERHVEVFVPCA